jgi:hypothetical protein
MAPNRISECLQTNHNDNQPVLHCQSFLEHVYLKSGTLSNSLVLHYRFFVKHVCLKPGTLPNSLAMQIVHGKPRSVFVIDIYQIIRAVIVICRPEQVNSLVDTRKRYREREN